MTPFDDCMLPACGCFGHDTSAANPSRPCGHCGLAHGWVCTKGKAKSLPAPTEGYAPSPGVEVESGEGVGLRLVQDMGVLYDDLAERKVLPDREGLKALVKYHDEHPFDPIGEHLRAEVADDDEEYAPPEIGVPRDGKEGRVDVEIDFDPNKAFVIKNTSKGNALLLDEALMRQVREVTFAQNREMEEVALQWLERGLPGAHPGELIVEEHQSLHPLVTGHRVLRVLAGPCWEGGGAGPVLLVQPGLRVKVTDD